MQVQALGNMRRQLSRTLLYVREATAASPLPPHTTETPVFGHNSSSSVPDISNPQNPVSSGNSTSVRVRRVSNGGIGSRRHQHRGNKQHPKGKTKSFRGDGGSGSGGIDHWQSPAAAPLVLPNWRLPIVPGPFDVRPYARDGGGHRIDFGGLTRQQVRDEVTSVTLLLKDSLIVLPKAQNASCGRSCPCVWLCLSVSIACKSGRFAGPAQKLCSFGSAAIRLPHVVATVWRCKVNASYDSSALMGSDCASAAMTW